MSHLITPGCSSAQWDNRFLTSKDGFIPLSCSQERFWLLDQLNPGTPVNHISKIYQLRGKLDLSALAKSLQMIVDRHEGLRTVFRLADGQPCQLIQPSLTITLPLVDLSHLSNSEVKEQISNISQEAVHQVFDLTKGPLIYVNLVRCGSDDHLFFLTVHHIIADGWSYEILISELIQVYCSLTQPDSPLLLPALPIQYAEYSIQQSQWLAEGEAQSQLEYWQRQLMGAPPITELIPDFPRPAVQTYRGAGHEISLNADLTRKLLDLSRTQRVTLFMTLISAFKLLLYRHTGQMDLVIGTPIAGRNKEEYEGLIGCFINNLALRTQLSPSMTFTELLNHVKQVCLDAYDHQEIPYERVIDTICQNRDLSRTPIFQILINMFTYTSSMPQLPGIDVSQPSQEEISSKFDLTIYINHRPDQLKFNLVYNSDLYESSRMSELLNQYHLLLSQIVKNPIHIIGGYSLITPQMANLLPDPAQELRRLGENPAALLFQQQVRRVPRHFAVSDNRVGWTYEQLDQKSNAIAAALLDGGIKPENVVAIYAAREASLVAAILGVMKAGAAFLILDPAHPEERLIECLRQARPQGWIQLKEAGEPGEQLQSWLESAGLVCALTLSPLMNDSPSFDPALISRVEIKADELAYVVFTSGSTGKPKGILGTHRPLSHFLQWYGRTFSFNETDRFSMLSGLSHDPLLRDIFTPLTIGATLFIPDVNDMTSGTLARWLQKNRISVTHLTPPQVDILNLELTSHGSLSLDLRYLFSVGERWSHLAIEKLHRFIPGVTCVNCYGCTETPQIMGYHIIPRTPLVHIALGKGIADAQLLLLNAAGQLAGCGELGEIHVRSPYLAKGYLGNQELTRERFIINPFTQLQTDRLYKTGDWGRYDRQGDVHWVGRLDNQVKIRGFRIELGEIEEVMAQYPEISQVAVIVKENDTGDNHLVAYVVAGKALCDRLKEEAGKPVGNGSTDGLNKPGDISYMKLRDYLKKKLPDHMIPSNIIPLDHLPMTPNGKIDRRQLLELNVRAGQQITPDNRPITTEEKMLTEVWQETLKIQEVGIDDNFFAIGGNSILALRIVIRIRELTGRELPLATFFQAPTIRSYSRFLTRDDADSQWSSLIAIQPGGAKLPFYFVHAIGGNVLGYQRMAHYLGPDYPVFGLQSRGLDGRQNPFFSIPEMANHYCREIRASFPQGPYLIGGHSFGGIVAYEIARQLTELQCQVGLLVVFDTSIKSLSLLPLRRQFAVRTKLWLERILYHSRQLIYLSFTDKKHYIERKLHTLSRRRASRKWQHEFRNARSKEGELLPMAFRDVREANYYASRNYVPKTYAGKVTLFRVQEQGVGILDRDYHGWDHWALGGVDVVEVPGDHVKVIEEPHVRVVAERLRDCIDRVKIG